MCSARVSPSAIQVWQKVLLGTLKPGSRRLPGRTGICPTGWQIRRPQDSAVVPHHEGQRDSQGSDRGAWIPGPSVGNACHSQSHDLGARQKPGSASARQPGAHVQHGRREGRFPAAAAIRDGDPGGTSSRVRSCNVAPQQHKPCCSARRRTARVFLTR